MRTLQELLTQSAARAKSFRRGSRIYDAIQVGYADDGSYILDTGSPGNANSGHDYATDLGAEEKRELMEYLKTL